MTLPTLAALYAAHTGKVSDRWSSHLHEYDRALREYREAPIRLLEIGVQNGGSLEIWAKYFPNAVKLIGTDHDLKALELRFADPRIQTVPLDSVTSQPKEAHEQLDLIIANAQQTKDVVSLFAATFPRLGTSGIYIVEGLVGAGGEMSGEGPLDPFSTLAFFKRLADIVNFEHWGCAAQRADVLRGISITHGVTFSEDDLARVHGVDFVNAMCIIRAAEPCANKLGTLIVAGNDEGVVAGLRKQAGQSFRPAWMGPPSEPFNDTSLSAATAALRSLDRDALTRRLIAREQELRERNREIVTAVSKIAELSDATSSLRAEHQQTLTRLRTAEKHLKSTKRDLARSERALSGMRRSPTWRYTRAFRVAGGFLKRRRQALSKTLPAVRRFDPEFYRQNNPDVAASGVDPKAHFVRFGKKEGRQHAPDGWVVTKVKRAMKALEPEGGYSLATRRVRKVLRQGGVGGATKRLVDLVSGRAPVRPAQPKAKPATTSARASRDGRNDYAEWIRRFDTLTDEGRAALSERARTFRIRPRISVLMPTYNPEPRWLVEAIESVRTQIYSNWELCIADDASSNATVRGILEHYAAEDSRIRVMFRETNGHISAASNSALEIATGDFVALLDHDDLLRPHALFWTVEAINHNPDVQILFSDEDKIDERGVRSSPYFKCEFNEELFHSHNMVCHLGVYRTELVRKLGGFRVGFEGAQDYDLALRCREQIAPAQIHHIPRVLYSWRIHPQSTASSGDAKPYALDAGARALNEHFARRGVAARAELTEFSMYRTRFALPDSPPMVSLIIPTRNAVKLVRQCIESILERTTYRNFEILLIDNGSDDEAALAYFAELSKHSQIRVLRDEQPFNYSALNNAAVKVARGEFVCLVNNDIEVITPDWLAEMVSIALQPGVGAVGARLWYPNDTLQHGGVVLGILGVAGHSHKHLAKQAYGYFARAALLQSFSAVTGACLLIRKSIYEAVSGLNENDLRIAFNDVDFCLRVREAGYRNVWTPYAELYHHESATRGFEDTPEKKQRFARETRFMKARWGQALLNDPAYSPNLTLQHEDFSLAWPPRLPGIIEP